MANVLIHRCTLRVVRRGGWSWGPAPKQLVDRLVGQIPNLLDRILADLLPEDSEQEVSAPVRIRIPIRQRDLDSLASNASVDLAASDPTLHRELTKKFSEVLRSEVFSDRAVHGSDSPPTASRASDEPPPRHIARRNRNALSGLPAILLRWHQHNLLQLHLTNASVEELEAWHALLITRPSSADATMPIEPAALAADFASFFASQPHPVSEPSRESQLRHRLRLAVEAAAQLQRSLADPLLWRCLDSQFPLNPILPSTVVSKDSRSPDPESSPAERNSHSSLAAHHAPSLPQSSFSAPATVRRSTWEIHIPCALPFLLLGSLSSLNLFDAMSAALQSARASDSGHLLAASLAYKVLAPPERGWLRSPASLATAAAFAGAETAIDEAELVELARQLAPFTELLDRTNIDALLTGHTVGEPFVIVRADSFNSRGYLLLDAQGCFPVCWSDSVSGLTLQLARSPRATVLISPDASDPSVLDSLDRAGVTFIAEVRPTRGEHWNRVALGPSTACWTNHTEPGSAAILRAALQYTQSIQEAACLWQELGKARVSAIRATHSNLDHALTLAAGTSLGTIAWKLWGARGRTTPQLVLDRFNDLDAYVKFTGDLVTVRLPLGRRHRELFDRGLLAPVDVAFWFGDRRVEFAGG